MKKQEILVEAIQNMTVVRFKYEGLNRIAEPHKLGQMGSSDELKLEAFQTGGQSESGGLPGWRTFDLDKIFGLELMNKTFSQPRKDYEENDKRFKRILAKVKKNF